MNNESKKFYFMKFIATKTHGYLDYIVGFLLIISPWMFDFDRGRIETWLPILLGASAIMYSLFTDYEMGVSRQIPMRMHLTLDLISGILLAVSPWLFGFADYVYAPHLILGIMEIGAALFTKTKPGVERTTYRSRRTPRAHEKSLS